MDSRYTNTNHLNIKVHLKLFIKIIMSSYNNNCMLEAFLDFSSTKLSVKYWKLVF